MTDTFQYGFWIWGNKLNPVLSMLSHLAGYELFEEEREIIKADLRTTNDEKGFWSSYTLEGSRHRLFLKLAYDSEEGSELIHLRINAAEDLKEKLELLEDFQSMIE